MNNTRAHSHSLRRIYLLGLAHVPVCVRVLARTYARKTRIYKAITCTAVSIIARIRRKCVPVARCGRRLTTENSRFRVINYFVADIKDDIIYYCAIICRFFRSPWKKFANYQIIFNLQIICELLRINRSMNVRYFYPVQTFLYFTSTYIFQRFYSRYQFVYLISKDLKSSVIDNSWYSQQRLFACSFSSLVIWKKKTFATT